MSHPGTLGIISCKSHVCHALDWPDPQCRVFPQFTCNKTNGNAKPTTDVDSSAGDDLNMFEHGNSCRGRGSFWIVLDPVV